jgi:hypothetical protein
MGIPDVVVMIHNGEIGRAVSFLETEVKDETKTLAERTECCRWLAECNSRLEDFSASGDWYLEGVKLLLKQQTDNRTKANQALPLCEKALECYRQHGDSADVIVASRLKQYLQLLKR